MRQRVLVLEATTVEGLATVTGAGASQQAALVHADLGSGFISEDIVLDRYGSRISPLETL